MHYYQFNIGDYASHTRHLSLLEDLAYRKLLDHYYLHEQALNVCSTSVARLIGMREHQQEVDAVLNEFFVLTDNGWAHTRAEREIEAYRDKIQKASNAGKASAQRRFNARSTDVQPNNNQEPVNINHKPVEKKATATRLSADWMLSPEDYRFCEKERPELKPETVAEQFRDYWIAQPGAKGRKLDWPATWRNWVRNQRQERQSTNFHDDRLKTIEALTGRSRNDKPNEIDITAEYTRITG